MTSVQQRVCGQYNDAGLWLSVNAEKKITPGTTLLFTEEFRLNENMSQVSTLFSDIGVMHKWNKYFSTGLFYRFMEKRNLDASYSARHRFYADVSGKYKFPKTTITIRERIQAQVKDYYSSETGRIPEWYLRSKLGIKYELTRKWLPFISAELFYQLSNPTGNEFDNVRYLAGLEFKINKHHSIEPFYMVQHEFHVNNPVTDFIAGIGYSASF